LVRITAARSGNVPIEFGKASGGLQKSI